MRFRLIFLPLALMLFTISSCKKTDPTTAHVYVFNSQNEPVIGARVKLIPEGSSNKTHISEVTAVTDVLGTASFDFTKDFKPGQVGVVIMNIDVNDGAGVGIIKIVEEKVSEKKIIL